MVSFPSDPIPHAATMLVTSALEVHPTDRFVVICDIESNDIGVAIGNAGEQVGAEVTVARLDKLQSVSTNHSGERPHKVLPDTVRRAMLAAQASAFVATAPRQEASMREQLLHIVGACKIRHAHMPQISKRAFANGLKVDFREIEKWSRAMERKLETARVLLANSTAGTNLRLSFAPNNRWTPHTGVIVPGQWTALPAGALYAQPESVEGVFVANASLGEFFGTRTGLLLTSPARLFIENGRVARVEAKECPQLERDIAEMLAVAPNSDRVGLVAIGVNAALDAATGDALVDENLPGLHLVIGDPAGRIRSSTFSARTSFFACSSGTSVKVDGSFAIYGGKLV